MMKIRSKFQTWLLQEDLNFLLTNRIPRITLTRFMGWWSKLEHPWIVKGSIAVWRWFSDLDLSESKQQHFDSIHACFTRELRAGLRPIDTDPGVMSSPCDAIVGACGEIREGMVFQAKGFPYTLEDLLGIEESIEQWRNGMFMTIRITSAMYHRFHAPADGSIQHIRYFSGDTWNVNPIALNRIEKLFCKNERAYLKMTTARGNHLIGLVPVAAVLVASIRIHGIDTLFHTRYQGKTEIACDINFGKGEELGWFEHGSTILMFVPQGFKFASGIEEGLRLKMGQALFEMPQ